MNDPYILDARKCISYRTIEYKSKDFPEEDSCRHDNWIYGCDICQEICPWNIKNQKKTPVQDFSPLKKEISRDEFFKMNTYRFSELYRGMVIERLGYERIMRNGVKVFHFKEFFPD